jgi:DNA-binding PadR family transcriptional regulator
MYKELEKRFSFMIIAKVKEIIKKLLPQISSSREIEETILLLLSKADKEMYGLEMVEQSNGVLREGIIYVYLAQLENQQLISSRPENVVERYPRRLYKISEIGRAYVKSKNGFKPIEDHSNLILGVLNERGLLTIDQMAEFCNGLLEAVKFYRALKSLMETEMVISYPGGDLTKNEPVYQITQKGKENYQAHIFSIKNNKKGSNN